ncbi:MAG: hypothetical protein ACFFG0_03190 [Candidatus Thorarchaeota archaeon]
MEINKNFIIIGMVVILVIGFIIGFLITMNIRCINNCETTFPQANYSQINSTDYNELFDEIIEYNIGLDYTIQTYDRCSKLSNMNEQFTCVGNFVVENYNYVPRNEIYSVDDLFDLGADCKSYSLYYATLAKMMGYNYGFFIAKDHMFTIAYQEGRYCILDEKIVQCFHY